MTLNGGFGKDGLVYHKIVCKGAMTMTTWDESGFEVYHKIVCKGAMTADVSR